ncbi:uncharacterized protein LOC128235933 [Mya arenaria]|uniref:uncharacterized protein LOC128235933 n=1 Tax=Mya arenaria TaxID=6604 RepID=UPI0022E2603F|nr:uncharacterized protein LOC128235933 [Mya arenaria]
MGGESDGEEEMEVKTPTLETAPMVSGNKMGKQVCIIAVNWPGWVETATGRTKLRERHTGDCFHDKLGEKGIRGLYYSRQFARLSEDKDGELETEFKYDGGVRDLASWPSLYKSVHQLLQSPPSSPSSQIDVEDIDEPGPSIQRPQQRQAAKKRTVARRGKGTSARRAAYKGKRPTTRTRRSKTPALRNNSGKVLAKQKEGMKKQVSKLTKPQLQAAITRAMEMEPGLMLLVLAAPAPGGNQPEGAGPQPEEGNIIPSWCVYGNCRDMPTQRERVCCRREACLSHTAVRILIKLKFNLPGSIWTIYWLCAK